MKKTVINLRGSKELLGSMFEMELEKIINIIRRESPDEKDKLILEHEATITDLTWQNRELNRKLEDLKRVMGK